MSVDPFPGVAIVPRKKQATPQTKGDYPALTASQHAEQRTPIGKVQSLPCFPLVTGAQHQTRLANDEQVPVGARGNRVQVEILRVVQFGAMGLPGLATVGSPQQGVVRSQRKTAPGIGEPDFHQRPGGANAGNMLQIFQGKAQILEGTLVQLARLKGLLGLEKSPLGTLEKQLIEGETVEAKLPGGTTVHGVENHTIVSHRPTLQI